MVVKRVPELAVVSLREVTPDFTAMGETLIALHHLARGRDDVGPAFALFHDDAYETEGVDWEAGLTLPDGDPERLTLLDGRTLHRRTLPPLERCASAVHEGRFLGLHLGYGALGAWIERSGLEVTGVGREIFWHQDPEAPERNVTEIQLPVRERAPAPTPARPDPALEAT